VKRVAARVRRLVVTIDFGHAGTGYGMEYKDGLCLSIQSTAEFRYVLAIVVRHRTLMNLCTWAAVVNELGLIRAFATDAPNGAGQTKAPTGMLLDQNMCCTAFGVEARRAAHDQRRRSELAMRRNGPAIQPFYFFEDFKMRLQDFEHGEEPKVKPTICLPGDTREFLVRDLVQRVYQRNMEQALKIATDEGQLPIAEVTWVLTVPAEWSDKARALVRKAADDALKSVGQGVDPPIEVRRLWHIPESLLPRDGL